LTRVLAAHQPNYLPWAGLFHKLGRADVWVIADDVQYTKHGLINRNRIRTLEGWQWLTVPVLSKGRGPQPIGAVEIDAAQAWRRKHWQALSWNYARAPYLKVHGPFLEEVYEREWQRLIGLNVELCLYLMRQFGIEVELRRSSALPLRQERSLRLVDMALACGCQAYLAGGGASRQYLDLAVFERAGIEVRFCNFAAPPYPQCFPGFVPDVTALDLLLNCGPQSRKALFGD
jgi:hypothetical protein